MSKQVLSVSDFALIINLLNENLREIEFHICDVFDDLDYEEYKKGGSKGEPQLRPTLSDKRVQKELKHHRIYQDLLNLKKSLQELNIEVETPEVEVKTRSSWQKDMYAVKPIKFEPPMWKDLKKEVEEIKTSKEEVEVKCVLQFNNGEVVHSVYFVKSEDEYTIELTDDDQVNETFEFSAFGYILAINKARIMFLEE